MIGVIDETVGLVVDRCYREEFCVRLSTESCKLEAIVDRFASYFLRESVTETLNVPGGIDLSGHVPSRNATSL